MSEMGRWVVRQAVVDQALVDQVVMDQAGVDHVLEEQHGSPGIGRLPATAYVLAVCLRTLVAMVCVAVLAVLVVEAVTAPGRDAGSAIVLAAAGLALLGVGLVLVALVLAGTDWGGASTLLRRTTSGQPRARLREPRTVIRPLAYAVVMLTLGGAVAVVVTLVVVGSCVALVSPVLVALGDRSVIGPFTVETLPGALLAALVGAALLAGLALVSPRTARAHALLVLQVLSRPEQRLRRDLTVTTRSRTRLVRAFDVERRRIERDLHDGVQPRLMSVSMTLGLALAEMPADAPGRDDVVRAQEQSRQTLEELRRFVRNIHPPVLVDHGLGAAVGELADTLTLPIDIEDGLGDRLPADVETNLYFCVAELLTNVVKHSGAGRAMVRPARRPGGDHRRGRRPGRCGPARQGDRGP